MTRRARLHHVTTRPGDEAGFTLIELLASLTIMAIGILAAVRVMDSAYSVAGQGGNRTRAVHLATAEAESIRAVPYDQIGFAVDQADYAATFEGANTVTLASPGPLAPSGPSTTMGGITYSFKRSITWVNATSQATSTVCSSGYKRVTVVISWTDHGGAHSTRQDSYVYPGGRGACGATTPTTAGGAGTPQPPTNLQASLGPVDTATTVTLTWTAPLITSPAVASYKVDYSTDVFLTSHTVTSSQPASTSTYQVTGLSPSTSYQLRVSSVGADGSVAPGPIVSVTTTAVVTTTTTSPPSGVTPTTMATTTTTAGCGVSSMTITPNAALRSGPGSTTLATSVVASVNTIGICANLQISYSPTKGVATVAYLNVTNGGNQTANVDGNTTWDTGTHLISVLDANANILATGTLTVCTWNSKSCP